MTHSCRATSSTPRSFSNSEVVTLKAEARASRGEGLRPGHGGYLVVAKRSRATTPGPPAPCVDAYPRAVAGALVSSSLRGARGTSTFAPAELEGNELFDCRGPLRVLESVPKTLARLTVLMFNTLARLGSQSQEPSVVGAALFACCLLLAAACESGQAAPAEIPAVRPASPPTEVVLQGETMGSTYTIKIAVADPAQVVVAQGLQTKIDETCERINDVMSTYRPNSEISRFNNHKSTEPFVASEELLLVVTKALAIGKRCEGAYDITLDPLIALWGFDRAGRRTEVPTDADIAAARAHVGPDRVAVVGAALQKRDPLTTINLGGIASGYAVDVVALLLERAGFHDYMVEITGEVRAHGKNARGAPWKIGIKVPRADDDPTSVAATVPLIDQSLTTSGSYHNFFEAGGRRYSHILDPKTGRPIDSDLVSVTVLYPDALSADGFDTPFMILGEEKARAIIAGHPGMEALFIHAASPSQTVSQKQGDLNGGPFRVTKTAGFPAIDVPEASP